jgi:hypothetical protein
MKPNLPAFVLIVVLLLVAVVVPSGAAPLAGPCVPGVAYNPACDVDHDGDVDIFDIQLTAGHWNRTGNWTTQSVPMLARMNGIPPTFDQQVTYGAPSGTSVANVNEDSVSMISPDTTLYATNLVVRLTVFVNNNSARRFTLRVNGTDTALSCTMGSFGTSCTSTEIVTVPPQSLLSIKSDRPAAFNAEATEARVSFQLIE